MCAPSAPYANTLDRWLRQLANGRLMVNKAKVKAEQRLDGKYVIATSDPHINAEDVALGYKNLLEAERGFRDLESNLLLRPVFHRLEHPKIPLTANDGDPSHVLTLNVAQQAGRCATS